MIWYQLLFLFCVAVAGGAVNAVAGGGTLLTFPALIFLGQGAIIANATNTVALWPGALSSFWGYRAELGYHRREVLLLSVPSFLGGVLGAWLLVITDPSAFDILVPYLILLATGLFIVQEPLARWQRRRAGPANTLAPGYPLGAAPGERAESCSAEPAVAAFGHAATPLRWTVVLLSQFLIGVYGGYFGAGIGILMLAAYGILGFSNIHQANAIKNLNAMFINGIAAAIFISQRLINWPIALLMAAGAIFGGYAGAGAARRLGQKNVRRLVIFIGLALAAKMLLKW
jgi:uncharacterized membrane protein YfcA